MGRINYNQATNYMMNQKKYVDFIDNSAAMVIQKCKDGVHYLEIEEEYIKNLKKLNLSRLESYVLIIEIREILEAGINDVFPCIDSFIDGIYTRHTGNCSFDGFLHFKNEPETPIELTLYVESNDWLYDTSWKEGSVSN